MRSLFFVPVFVLAGLALAVPVRAQSFDDAGAVALVARVNAMRGAKGLSTLERDARLDQAARVLSAEMAKSGKLAHVSAQTGTPADRVAAAGVKVSALVEEIAHGKDAIAAHESLVGSAAHLQRLLDPKMTHIGVAVAVNDAGAWVTELLARIEAPQPAEPPPPPYEMTPQPEAPAATPAVPAPAPAEAAEPPPATQASAAQASPPAPSPSEAPAASQDGGLTVRVTVPPPTPGQAPIVGYWIYSGGRWWYYPRPADAGSGTELQPDLSVQGAPPGYESTVPAEGTTVPTEVAPPEQAAPPVEAQPAPPVEAAPPPPRRAVRVIVLPPRPRPWFGWSPRRHYWRWRFQR